MKFETFFNEYKKIGQAIESNDIELAISHISILNTQTLGLSWSRQNQIDRYYLWSYLEELIELCDKLEKTNPEINDAKHRFTQIINQSKLSGVAVHKALLEFALKGENAEPINRHSEKTVKHACQVLLQPNELQSILTLLKKSNKEAKNLSVLQAEKAIKHLSLTNASPHQFSQTHLFLAQLYAIAYSKKKGAPVFLNLSSYHFKKSIEYFAKNHGTIPLIKHYLQLAEHLDEPLKTLLHDNIYYMLINQHQLSQNDLQRLAADAQLSTSMKTTIREFALMHPRARTARLLYQFISFEFQKNNTLTLDAFDQFFIDNPQFIQFKRLFNYHNTSFHQFQLPLSSYFEALSNEEHAELSSLCTTIPTIYTVLNPPTRSQKSSQSDEKKRDIHQQTESVQTLTEKPIQEPIDRSIQERKHQQEIQQHNTDLDKITRIRRTPDAKLDIINTGLKLAEKLLRAAPTDTLFLATLLHERIALILMKNQKEAQHCKTSYSKEGSVIIDIDMQELDTLGEQLTALALPHLSTTPDIYHTLGKIPQLHAQVLEGFRSTRSEAGTLLERQECAASIETKCRKSITLFEQAISIDPMYAAARWDLTQCLMQLNEHDAAITHYLYLVENDSEYKLDAQFSLANLYFCRHQNELALVHLKNLIQTLEMKKNPSMLTPHQTCFTLGKLYYLAAEAAERTHDISQANDFLMKAQKEHTRSPLFDCFDTRLLILNFEKKSNFKVISNYLKYQAPALIVFERDYFFCDYIASAHCFATPIKITNIRSICADLFIPTATNQFFILPASIQATKLYQFLLSSIGNRSVFFQQGQQQFSDNLQTKKNQYQQMIQARREHHLFTSETKSEKTLKNSSHNTQEFSINAEL